MKKLIMFSIATLASSFFALKAQNLVPNWSFEEHDSCPYNEGQIYFANGWFNVAYHPDYHNACSSTPFYTVPTTFDTHVFYSDTTGVADALIVPYSKYVLSVTGNTPPNLRISLGCQLETPLQIGQKYYVSFAVKFILANYPTDSGIGYNSASNKIGALFSTVSYVMPKDSELYRSINFRYSLLSIRNYAQVYTNNIISDTSHWVVISGSFIADSAYKYMNIGNFFDDTLTSRSLLFIDTMYSYCYQALYLVDNVCVTDDSAASCAIEATAIENIKVRTDSMYVTPNPFSQYAVISIPYLTAFAHGNAYISVFDMMGRRIRDCMINLTNGEYIFPRENLSNGIYFILVNAGNKLFKQKILITN